jgi:tetratricopeptide (TPR) repeat protein
VLTDDDRRRLAAAVGEHRAGRIGQAAAAYEQLLQRHPDDAEVMQRLGVAVAQLGRPVDGARLMSASLQLKPDQPQVMLNLARALLDAGQADEALRCCDNAIALGAGTADCYRLRGRALTTLNLQTDALANYGQAVRLAPDDASALMDLGVALEAAGRDEDALTCFERVLVISPGMTPAHHRIASIHTRRHDHLRALQSLDRALALQPDAATLHNNRGNALKELGRLAEAAASYTRSLELEPTSLDTRHNRALVNSLLQRHAEAWQDYRELLSRGAERPGDLVGAGTTLLALGRAADALTLLERAAQQLPDSADAHIQHGVALLRLERHDEAIVSFDRALVLNRDLPEVINNRGVASAAAGRYEDAIADFIRAGATGSDRVDVHTNLGLMFRHVGRYRDAALSFDRALALKPDDAAAAFELSFLHLSQGDFTRGWPLYEARFRVPALAIPARNLNAPRWTGRESLAGKSILVHAEQGLGDTIQFARYLSLLVARGATPTFEVMPQLERLMHSLPDTIRVITRSETPPAADFHCPLLSLPLALGTNLQTIPAATPYLSAKPERTARWAGVLQSLVGLRVGLAWQGNPQVERLLWARGRSMPLQALAPLAAVAGVSFVSLQKGVGAEQLRQVSFGDCVLDLSDQLDNGPDAFIDTAAVMQNLDLVISTDTAIAHLAGALARPAWIALHASAEWRWLLERSDTPWYSSLRLFRQADRTGSWQNVVTHMAAALTSLAAGRAGGS